MAFEISLTTAEHIIGAVDAALQKQDGVDPQLVGDFLDLPADNAKNALIMATELRMLEQNSSGLFFPNQPFSKYLVTSDASVKAAVLRFFLEVYPPYILFKSRLMVSGNVNDAANQMKAIYTINSHRQDIVSTLISLGTYTNSISSKGAGKYVVNDDNTEQYLLTFESNLQNRENAAQYLRRALGDEVCGWINEQDVFNDLAIAVQLVSSLSMDARSVIVHAGNAIESFLAQVATHLTISIVGANGINAKVEKLSQANVISTKYKFVFKYLGHIRNAADHGIDSEIGASWLISDDTAKNYVSVSITAISSYINQILHNQYTL